MKRILQNTYFPIILAPLLLFLPTLLSGKALFWGTPSTQFIPWWDYAWDSILSGQFPLWNPWVGMGAPLVANYQSALFYPPYWVLLGMYGVGGVKLMAWSVTILVIFHLSWGGIGISKLLKELGIGKLGQIFSGLAFALSGYLVARAGFLSINATVAWMPWVLLFSKQLVDGKRKALLNTGIGLGLMFLAGHAQTAWYTILLGGLWIVFWSLYNPSVPRSIKYSLIAIGRYIWAGMIGIGLSAIQILPTAEYLFQSARISHYEFSEAMTYSFWPWRFLTILVPNLFGSPASGNYWGYGNYWEDALYIGILPIILALGQILKIFKIESKQKVNSSSEHRPLRIFLFLIVGIGFLFSLGNNTPVFPFLYKYIPTFDLFQAPTRFSIWSEFGLILLAGIGVNSLNPPIGKRLYWNRLAVAGCAAISGAAGLAFSFLGDIKTTLISSIGMAGLLGIGTSLLLLYQPEKEQQKKTIIWQNILIGFLGLDLLAAGYGLNPAVDLDFYGVGRSHGYESRLIMSDSVEYDLKFNHFFNFDTFESDQDWKRLFDYGVPNTAMLKRIEMVNNFDPITTARYQTWMEHVNNLDLTDVDQLAKIQALDLMEVGGISERTSDGYPQVKNIPAGPVEEIMYFGCARIMENDNNILELIFSGQIDLSDEIILEVGLENQEPICNRMGQAQIQVLEKNPGKLILDTGLKEDGWIFWSQSWYPGWMIKIDGVKTGPTLRANYYFQAAEVSAGNHQVEFAYNPISFKLGLILTAAVLLLVCYFYIKEQNNNN